MLDVTVKPLSSSAEASSDATALVLLHLQGRFRLLERSLQDFQHLERQLQLTPSIAPAIEAYCVDFDPKKSFYTPQERGSRLSFALETFLSQLVAQKELLQNSLALKTFLDADVLSSHHTFGESYRKAVQTALETGEMWEEEKVPAGCVVEHEVAVDLPEDAPDKKLVLWKFASQGRGLVFSADFSKTVAGLESDDNEIDPYSSTEVLATTADAQEDPEVAHYRTSCEFSDKVEDAKFMFGHFVAENAGIVTLQWENADTTSVLSKPVRFQTKVVPMSAAATVLKIVDSLSAADSTEWLHEHMEASRLTSLEEVPGWNDEVDESGGFGDDEDCEYHEELGIQADTEQKAVLEQRTHELEGKVIHLEETLAATRNELKTALDRVQIAEEIYKANLETITQLEFAAPKKESKKLSTESVDQVATPVLAVTSNQSDGVAKGTQPDSEGTPPTRAELERVQRLCASFQEQCLWRSVESTELEAQLAASRVETESWREKHATQTAQIEALEAQNCTLRSHKKLLVQEVKRLQPYSQVNLAALVQEAQEARMVQRSLQAKLDSQQTADSTATDFVLVDASDEQV